SRAGGFVCQAEDGIRVLIVTGVQTCALPIYLDERRAVPRPASTDSGSTAVAQPARPDRRTVDVGVDLRPSPAQHHGTSGIRRNTDRKSTRLNSSHDQISYAVFCLKKKNK